MLRCHHQRLFSTLALVGLLGPTWAAARPVPGTDPASWNCVGEPKVCSFAGFDLTRTDLTLSPMRGYNFSDTLLPGPWPRSAPSGVRLSGAEIVGGAEGWLATATSISGVTVRQARLRDVSLAGRLLNGARFAGVEFVGVDFRSADFTN